MTNPDAADNRRATALVCHYGRHNIDGFNAVLEETADEDRGTELIGAVLALHAQVIPILLTGDGLACLTGAIYTRRDDPDYSDGIRNAARLVTADSEGNIDDLNEALREATTSDWGVTYLVFSVLSMFSTLVPILYSELGLRTLERSIIDWAAREDQQ